MIGGPAKVVTGAAIQPRTLSYRMNPSFSTCSNRADRIKPNPFWAISLMSLALGIGLPCPSLTAQESPQDSKTGQKTWADVAGQIVVEGQLPEIPPERVGSHKDRPVCLVDGNVPPDDQLVVDADGGMRDVFVILLPVDSGAKIPVHSSYLQTVQTTLQLDNTKCRFQPHAMAVMTGQEVLLKNSDSVGHNCKIASMNNEHNVNLPAGGKAEIKLEAVDRIPANVTCDIHPWMDALILAKDHPYVVITSSNGKFEMKNVPAGKWKLQFWHQRVGFMRKLEIPETKVDRRGRIDVELVAGKELDLGKMKLPSSAIK
jgi:plastocyanin